MNILNSISIVFCLCLIFVLGNETKKEEQHPKEEEIDEIKINKLIIKIYYETLCSDSIVFFRRKLYNSMIVKNRIKYTDLKLIPYGKVQKYDNPISNKTELFCQHGILECELNAIHGCIIENTNIIESLNMINCLVTNYKSNIEMCAAYNNINIDKVKECADKYTITEILEKYGNETSLIDLTSVPSIGVDNIFNYKEQYNLIHHFDSMFCRKYFSKYNVTLDAC